MAKIRFEKLRTMERRKLYYGLYGFAAGLFFLWALFPSDYFADYLEGLAAKHGDGLVVTIETAHPTLSLGLAMKGVVVSRNGIMNIEADYLKVRPGYFSLLGKKPAVSFSSEVFGGKIKGKIRWDMTRRGAVGVEKLSMADIDLAVFKDQVKGFMPKIAVTGILNADGGYSPEGRGNGLLNLNIRNLTIQPAEPFFTLKQLTFNDVSLSMDILSTKLGIEKCVIEGNEIDGTMTGSISLSDHFDRSLLRLTGTLKPEKSLMDKLSQTMPIQALVGNAMGPDGRIPFQVEGPVSEPRYSFNN